MVAYSPGPEWIVILVIVVLIFGAKKLPELARSFGKSTSEFKKGVSEGASEADEASTSDDTEQPAEGKAPSPE